MRTIKRKKPYKWFVVRLSDTELQELYGLMDSLGEPLYKKLKEALASTAAGRCKGTFLWHVMMKYRCNTKRARKELKNQYKKQGVPWMERYWGFFSTAIYKGLHELGIRIKPRIYSNAPHGLASEAFRRYGGIEKVLKRFQSIRQFSLVCKITCPTLGQYLHKNGYHYNRKERKWKKYKGGKNGNQKIQKRR